MASKDTLLSDICILTKNQLFWYHIASSKHASGDLSSSVVLEEREEQAWTEREKAAESVIWPHPWTVWNPNVNSKLSLPLRFLWRLFMGIQKSTCGRWRLRRLMCLLNNTHLRMIINQEMSDRQKLLELRHIFSLYFGFWFSDNVF